MDINILENNLSLQKYEHISKLEICITQKLVISQLVMYYQKTLNRCTVNKIKNVYDSICIRKTK